MQGTIFTFDPKSGRSIFSDQVLQYCILYCMTRYVVNVVNVRRQGVDDCTGLLKRDKWAGEWEEQGG